MHRHQAIVLVAEIGWKFAHGAAEIRCIPERAAQVIAPAVVRATDQFTAVAGRIYQLQVSMAANVVEG
jgi:hypothetical protein